MSSVRILWSKFRSSWKEEVASLVERARPFRNLKQTIGPSRVEYFDRG